MIKEIKGRVCKRMRINQDIMNKEQANLEKNQIKYIEMKNIHNKSLEKYRQCP